MRPGAPSLRAVLFEYPCRPGLGGGSPHAHQPNPPPSLPLFGSRVRDDATPDSDLDVLVEFARPVTLSSFIALEARLGATTGWRVDLVSAAALKPYIGAHVRTEAVAL
jgi:predicted nucleotidyltransferase